ncbi:MAG: radical SAM protein [Patescibacteria group bacterium]|nr:radical SAM protein [Patescibacteria group bacterium]
MTKSLDILFINPQFRLNPPFDYKLIDPPRNLALLAAYVRKNDTTSLIIDMPISGISYEELIEEAKNNIPKMFAISNRSTYSFPIVQKIANLLKKNFPDIPIIVGGTYVSFQPEEALKTTGSIDYIVIGEGEHTLSELSQCILAGSDCSNLSGIAFRDKNGEIKRNKDAELIRDLAEIPLPEVNLLPMEIYVKRNERYILDISRGCLFACDYCTSSYVKKNIRYRPVENIISEIKVAYDLGFRNFYFFDDLFTANKKFVIEICKEIIKNDLFIKWPCMTRLKFVDDEVLSWMRKAGCDLIAYGVESTSEKYLKEIGKFDQLTLTEDVFSLTRSHGIRPLAFVIFGLPETTFNQEMETIKFLGKVKADAVGAFTFKPYPGTIYFSKPHEHGLNIVDYNFSKWSQLDEATHETKLLTKSEIIESMVLCNTLFRSGDSISPGKKYRRRKNVCIIKTKKGGVIYNPYLPENKRKTDMYLSCKKLTKEYFEVLYRCDGYHNHTDICNTIKLLFSYSEDEARSIVDETLNIAEDMQMIEVIPDVMEHIEKEDRLVTFGGGLV